LDIYKVGGVHVSGYHNIYKLSSCLVLIQVVICFVEQCRDQHVRFIDAFFSAILHTCSGSRMRSRQTQIDVLLSSSNKSETRHWHCT